MAQAPPSPPPADSRQRDPVEPLLDAERLDVYRVAIEFQRFAVSAVARRSNSGLRDQLDRASASIVLNIAEAAGRSSAPDKARFYAIARGSATECAAALDVLVARGLLPAAQHRPARSLLIRIVQMLTKLIGLASIAQAPRTNMPLR